MAMSGDLSAFPLSTILQMFERASKTGQLSISTPNGLHRIAFYHGRIVAAIAPEQDYALKQILMTSAQLNAAGLDYLRNSADLCEPIGNAMKKQGLIASSALALAFRQQVQVGLLRLFHLKEGAFHFTSDEPLPYAEMTGMSQGGVEVAMLGLREAEEKHRDNSDFPQPGEIFVRISKDLPILKLSPLEWSLWEKAAPDQTLSDLSQVLNADLFEAQKACQRLVKVGLLTKNLRSSSLHRTQPVPSARNATVAAKIAVQEHLAAISSDKSKEAAAEENNDAQEAAINPNLFNRFTSLLRSLV